MTYSSKQRNTKPQNTSHGVVVISSSSVLRVQIYENVEQADYHFNTHFDHVDAMTLANTVLSNPETCDKYSINTEITSITEGVDVNDVDNIPIVISNSQNSKPDSNDRKVPSQKVANKNAKAQTHLKSDDGERIVPKLPKRQAAGDSTDFNSIH